MSGAKQPGALERLWWCSCAVIVVLLVFVSGCDEDEYIDDDNMPAVTCQPEPTNGQVMRF